MLIATDDDEVELFAEHRHELSQRFRLASDSPLGLAWALDKRCGYALAARHGVAHPRTWDAAGDGALDNPALEFPVIVKPKFRPRAVAEHTPKAWPAADRDQLKAMMRVASQSLAAEDLMIQELIPGGGEQQLAYTALCRDGEVLASLAACRRRQWPPDFGAASSYVETIDEAEVAGPAQRLLAATAFTGIIELEFKRDARDGRLALLDINPRPWGWISLAPAAGVDFSYLLFRMLLGDKLPRVHGRAGVRWVRMSTDIPAAVTALGHGEVTFGRYVRGLRPRIACAVFAPDDPLPALVDAPLQATIGARRWLRGKLGRAEPKAREQAPRALIVLENSYVPGDPRVWQEALSLRGAGWDVSILTPHADSEVRPDDEVIEGVRIHRFRLRQAEASRLGYLGEYAAAMWHIWRGVRQMARPAPFDVIHACNPPDFLLLAAVGQRRRGTRLVFDHHDLSPEMYAARCAGEPNPLVARALLKLERLAFALADVVLATNGSVARVGVERNGMAPEKVFIVRNGPRLDRFTPLEADPELSRGREHLLVYVGMMGPQDGVHHALQALAHLRQRRSDWHALFVGDGETLPSLKELSSDLGLDDHVEFAGFGTERQVRRAICSADVCLAPDPRTEYSDRSTLMKIAEYMAMARPTVSYDLTESRVTADGAALFAHRNDPGEFARRIDELLSDGALRRKLGAEGRARVEREFAWEHSERALLAAYRQLIGAAAPELSPLESRSPEELPRAR